MRRKSEPLEAAENRAGAALPTLIIQIPMGGGSQRQPDPKKKDMTAGHVLLFGAGYGSRTRLFGLGSRRTTDVLTLRILFYSVPILTL